MPDLVLASVLECLRVFGSKGDVLLLLGPNTLLKLMSNDFIGNFIRCHLVKIFLMLDGYHEVVFLSFIEMGLSYSCTHIASFPSNLNH